MRKVIVYVWLSVAWACSPDKPSTAEEATQTTPTTASDTTQVGQAQATNSYADATIETKTFAAEGGGFGYDIYINGTRSIHQPHRPGLPGNQGFATEEKAQKAGEFVATKIRKNLMPPSVTKEELDSLGVL